MRMLRVALTGGIGSGKSAVADRFRDLGIPIIDADIITRELVKPGSPALQRIAERFGNSVLGTHGRLNRRKLRQLIFEDQNTRHDLEDILHPRVKTAILGQLRGLSSPYALVVVPLLVESGMVGMFDRVLVVDCDETAQIKRVIKRDNCSENEAHAIIQSQASRHKRLAIATDVINNGGDIRLLNTQIQQLHQSFLDLLKQKK